MYSRILFHEEKILELLVGRFNQPIRARLTWGITHSVLLCTNLPREPELQFLEALAGRVELVGPGVEVQHEGGGHGGNDEPEREIF